MNIIEKIAEETYTIYIKRRPKKHEEIILKIKDKIYDIDNKLDQIKFLTFILNKTKDVLKNIYHIAQHQKHVQKTFNMNQLFITFNRNYKGLD